MTQSRLGWRLAVAALIAMTLTGRVMAAGFPESLRGEWQGTYCGDGTTYWWIDPTPSRAWAREHWCNGFTCGDLDYRIVHYDPSTHVIQFTPYYVTGWSISGYTIIMLLTQDGNRLEGGYVNHPRCKGIHLQKVRSTLSAGPLQWSSAAPLPAPSSGSGSSSGVSSGGSGFPAGCKSDNLEQRIKACTDFIDSGKASGKQLSMAYNNRAAAYADLAELDRKANRCELAIPKYDRSIADYLQALQLDPDNSASRGDIPLTYLDRGQCQYLIGDYGKAIADLTEAAQRWPDVKPAEPDVLGWIYAWRGWSYYQLGQDDRAIGDFNQVIAQWAATNYASLHFGFHSRGHVQLTKGEFDLAIADFSKALELVPASNTDRKALYLYERGIAKRGKGDDAGGNADIAAATAIKADVKSDLPELHN